jgi:hypothetical protein
VAAELHAHLVGLQHAGGAYIALYVCDPIQSPWAPAHPVITAIGPSPERRTFHHLAGGRIHKGRCMRRPKIA